MKTLTRLLISAAAAAALLVCAATASADQFTINFLGSAFSGTLNVDATLQSPGVYAIDSIGGNVGFTPVTGLVPTTTSTGYSFYPLPDGSHWFYDNLLFANSSPVLDNGGILFTLAGLAQPVNLFYDTQGEFEIYIGGGNFPKDFVANPVQISVVPTPEPTAFVLALGGLGFLLAALATKKFPTPTVLTGENA